ncbi:MAG: hypothetical protein Q8S20_18455 [Sulfuritalea sp.]|nr:hypothetical protein [Sulfuritalea sp.]
MNRTIIVSTKAQCNEAGIIDEALTASSAAAQDYLNVLEARAAAADRGEFASETEVAKFFAGYDV